MDLLAPELVSFRLDEDTSPGEGPWTLVLQGGGLKGIFEKAVIKALELLGYRFGKDPSGVSVGALNAAGYAAGGVDLLDDVWKKITPDDIYIHYKLARVLLRIGTGALGIYDWSPLRRTILRELDGPGPYGDARVGRVSLRTGCWDYTEATVETVLASASMPIFAPPVAREWVDGGIRYTSPLQDAIDRGAERIVLILCNPLADLALAPYPTDILKIMMRTIDIMTHQISLVNVRETRRVNDLLRFAALAGVTPYSPNKKQPYRYVPLRVFAPPVSLGDTLTGDRKTLDWRDEIGTQAAEQGPVHFEDLYLHSVSA